LKPNIGVDGWEPCSTTYSRLLRHAAVEQHLRPYATAPRRLTRLEWVLYSRVPPLLRFGGDRRRSAVEHHLKPTVTAHRRLVPPADAFCGNQRSSMGITLVCILLHGRTRVKRPRCAQSGWEKRLRHPVARTTCMSWGDVTHALCRGRVVWARSRIYHVLTVMLGDTDNSFRVPWWILTEQGIARTTMWQGRSERHTGTWPICLSTARPGRRNAAPNAENSFCKSIDDNASALLLGSEKKQMACVPSENACAATDRHGA
jgi:hypothetical protein